MFKAMAEKCDLHQAVHCKYNTQAPNKLRRGRHGRQVRDVDVLQV
jgi:hypothetical protein